MGTVRPNDQSVRLLVRSAVAVVLHGLAVEVVVEPNVKYDSMGYADGETIVVDTRKLELCQLEP